MPLFAAVAPAVQQAAAPGSAELLDHIQSGPCSCAAPEVRPGGTPYGGTGGSATGNGLEAAIAAAAAPRPVPAAGQQPQQPGQMQQGAAGAAAPSPPPSVQGTPSTLTPSCSSDDLQATAAASSSPALAASAAEPAVREDLRAERASMLLLMAPKEVWQEIGDGQLRQEVLALLDTSLHSVVAAEVEYLAAQLWQLPIMQQALEESEASGHTCASDHCTAPGCGEDAGSPAAGGGGRGGGSGNGRHLATQPGSGGGSGSDDGLQFEAQPGSGNGEPARRDTTLAA